MKNKLEKRYFFWKKWKKNRKNVFFLKNKLEKRYFFWKKSNKNRKKIENKSKKNRKKSKKNLKKKSKKNRKKNFTFFWVRHHVWLSQTVCRPVFLHCLNSVWLSQTRCLTESDMVSDSVRQVEVQGLNSKSGAKMKHANLHITFHRW